MQTVCNTYWDAGKGNLTAQNTRKPFGGRALPRTPLRELNSASANPLVGGEGLAVPSPRTPSPTLGPSGLASPTPTPKLVPTPLQPGPQRIQNLREPWGIDGSRICLQCMCACYQHQSSAVIECDAWTGTCGSHFSLSLAHSAHLVCNSAMPVWSHSGNIPANHSWINIPACITAKISLFSAFCTRRPRKNFRRFALKFIGDFLS